MSRSHGRVRLRACLVVAGATALLACQDVTGSISESDTALEVSRDTQALFQSDSLRYRLTTDETGSSTQIGVEFTNRTARPAYFVNCNGATSLSLEKLVDGQWQRVWSPVLPLCLSTPIAVPSGASYRTDIAVFGGPQGSNRYPQFSTTDLSGIYRIVWHELVHDYQDRLPWGEPLASENKVSNRFVLTEQRP